MNIADIIIIGFSLIGILILIVNILKILLSRQ
jgi:hypothetical protein